MRVCAGCGAPASPVARFCVDCGRRLAPPTELAPPPGEALAATEEPGLTFSGLVTSRWRLELPNGVEVAVEGPLVIGRRPDAAAAPPRARLVTVDDPDRTVSRSHLIVAPSVGGVLLTDLSGHNGVVIEGLDGSERRFVGSAVEVGEPCGIRLGAVRILLRSA